MFSPSLRDIELTMHLPCTHLSPDVMTSHLEESIMSGIRAISGSDEMRLRKVVISFCASSSPSSILISMTGAPSSTCFLAISSASSYFFSFMSRRNLREPATLHRSPMLMKRICGVFSNFSSPLRHSVCGAGVG